MTSYDSITRFMCLASLGGMFCLAPAHARDIASFDEGWRFARFGLMADGTRTPEPGTEAPLIRITASSEEVGPDDRRNVATNVLDGNSETRWCASGPGGGQWLQLDLGAPTDIAKADIVWEVDSPAWQAEITGRDGSGEWQPLPGKFRYLQVKVTANAPGKWSSIRELTLTGKNGSPIKNRMIKNGGDPKATDFNDSAWRSLNLPHDWAIEGPFRYDLAGETGKLPWQGIGWYRKHFTVPDAAVGKRLFLDFDGAMANPQVYCNGQLAGGWAYGYASFRVDITQFVKPGAGNVIAVRLDTEKWGSRWYPGAGIYRHVRLVMTEPVHVAQWGVFVTTPEISKEAASIDLAVKVDNTGLPAHTTVIADIFEYDKDNTIGAKVASTEPTEEHGDYGHTIHEVNLRGIVKNPKLWDVATPNRYLARVTVSNYGKVVDTYDQPFGIRTIAFTHDDGFHLNGKRVQLQGVCQHHDLGALGAAVNARATDRQLEILKGMGCNAIRTAHNPPSPELLDAADRLGFLVMDETFDVFLQGKKPYDYSSLFAQWREKDITMLVTRDRNHPSVIMWSMGNEIPEQHELNKHYLFKENADIIHALDKTRPVTGGISLPKETAMSGLELLMDVHGMNYAVGLYGGPDFYGKFLTKPGHEKIVGYSSESSSTISSRGEYPPELGRWQVTSYDQPVGWGSMADAEFAALDKYPGICGEFVWTGFDYLGEPTPFTSDPTNLLNAYGNPEEVARIKAEIERIKASRTTSRSSYFGIVDLAGFPKDRYYLYQARWRPELPMAHILPHWNWAGHEGKNIPVQVHTSGDEAELFLNGKSLGRQKKAQYQYRFQWSPVAYQPGELKVVTYKNGKEWATETVRTTGAATKLAMAPDRDRIKGDGSDLSFITVRVTDKDGVTVPRSHNPLHFSISGPGKIIATDNGDATSFESFQSPDRKAFNGLALVIVRAEKGAKGTITVSATGDGLAESNTTVRAE
ncbi:MAG: beta-galactosidase GalB [Luteolibacter sp.]